MPLSFFPPTKTDRSDSILRQIITSAPPQVPPELAPVELAAIVRRAMSPELDARYPDAVAMASDLERWLSGQQVLAHTYTPGQLAQRVIAAWRAPLMVAMFAVVALVAGSGLFMVQLKDERDRALEAEQSAQMAQQTSDKHLLHLGLLT